MSDQSTKYFLFFLALCAYACTALINTAKSNTLKNTPPAIEQEHLPASESAEELRGEVEALRAGMMLTH